MKRLLWFFPLFALAACIVVPVQRRPIIVEGGYYSYRGPFVFTYVAGHPLPGGGWCSIAGPHTHDYAPPPSREFQWRRGHGYTYVGPYHANRPPPATYWPRPAPRPDPSRRPPLPPRPVAQPSPARPDPYQP